MTETALRFPDIGQADPRPWLRCVCVHREISLLDLAHLLPASTWEDRCHDRPTQEDGLCDHCRADEGCPCCAPAVRGSANGSCRWGTAPKRQLVALDTPCQAVRV